MDLRQLKYFIAVAQELNIGRAATRLNISQPPLTRQIQQLEEEIGVQLVIRTPKGVELTQAGEMLLNDAVNIRSLVEQAIERTQRAGQGKFGRLDVGVFGSGILQAIPRLLMSFSTAYPGVNIVLHAMGKTEQIEALRQRRITVGFNRMLTPLSDITSEVVITESLVVAVNSQHPLAKEQSIALKDLAGQPLVLFPNSGRPNFIDKVMELCQREGFVPEVAQEVGDAVTSIALVASGFGHCLVPESATAFKLPGVVYVPLKNAPHAIVDLSCMYRKDDKSPILDAFLEVVRSFKQVPKVTA